MTVSHVIYRHGNRRGEHDIVSSYHFGILSGYAKWSSLYFFINLFLIFVDFAYWTQALTHLSGK